MFHIVTKMTAPGTPDIAALSWRPDEEQLWSYNWPEIVKEPFEQHLIIYDLVHWLTESW